MFARSIIVTLFCFASAASFIAAAEDTWEVIVPALERSSIQHVHVLPDGDILVAGHASLTTPNFSGIWVARYAPTGDQIWSQEFIGRAHSRASKLLVANDRIVVVGTHMVRNPFQGDSAGFVAELDLDGRIVWETWVEEDRSSVWFSKVDELRNGDFLLSGGFSKRDDSIRDAAFFSRMTANGKIKWSLYPLPQDDYYEDLPEPKTELRDKDGNVILMESAGPVREQDNGDLHLHIFRREVMPHNDQVGRCVVVSFEGEILIGKSCTRIEKLEFANGVLTENIELKKVSPGAILTEEIEVSRVSQSGDLEWSWRLQTPHQAGITDAVFTSDGGVIGVGYLIIESEPRLHRYDAVVFKLDSEGNEIWSHTYRSDRRDIFSQIVALDEDSFIIVGHTGAIAQSGWWDPWIIRIGANGTVRSQTELVR